MLHRICLNRPTQAKVCSPAWVLKLGLAFFSSAGEKLSRHCTDTWFFKWNTSITFSTFNHSWSRGGAKGRGFFATLSLAKLHILSYAKAIDGSWVWPRTNVSSHCRRMRNTCDGDSDLIKEHIKHSIKKRATSHNSCALNWLVPVVYQYMQVLNSGLHDIPV